MKFIKKLHELSLKRKFMNAQIGGVPILKERERLVKIFSDAFIGIEPLYAAFGEGLKAVYEAGKKGKLDEPDEPEPKFKGG